MANNIDITVNDFQNICRTCLSSEGLKPLYQKKLAERLMSCTVVKYAENDGLPTKICSNCINEIDKAFSFAKRCEATDEILRKCVIKLETEVANNSSHSQKTEPTIKTEEEIKPAIICRRVEEVFGEYNRIFDDPVDDIIKNEIDDETQETEVANNSSHSQKTEPTIKTEEEIKPAIIYRTVKEVLGEYECMKDIKQEEDVKMELEENWIEVKDDLKLEMKCVETYDDPVNESNENDDDDELRDETCSDNSGVRNPLKWSQVEKKSSIVNDHESYQDDDNQDERCSEEPDKSDSRFNHTPTNFQINDDEGLGQSNNSGSRPRRRCTVSQIEKKRSKDNDSETHDDPGEDSYEEEVDAEDQDETYSEKHDNSGSRLKRKTFCHQTNEASTKSSKGINEGQKGLHTGKKPHICEVCSKGFSLNTDLKRHMRIHTGEKPFACKDCNKGFTQSGYLKLHMRVHTGEKPCVCKVCNKGFTQSGCVKLHMRVHTGEKPFVCMVCNKGFTQSGHLKKHMRIHTGKKPYTCEVCSKSFSQSTSLNRHIKNTH